MNNSNNNQKIAAFEKLLMSTGREGMDKLIATLIRKTDFYTAPASIQNYNAVPGGLLTHSLNVYKRLLKQVKNPESIIGKLVREKKVTKDSLIIIALLHDVYKINHFVSYNKNVKCYDEDVIKKTRAHSPGEIRCDSKGEYVWCQTIGYQVDDAFPLGKYDKSIIFLQKFINLKWDEMMAIKWAFGQNGESLDEFAESVRRYPLVLALYEAKMEAMFFDR